MKGLKEFLEALKENKALFSEVEKVQDDTAKIVEIAKKHGYSFTEDEYNDLKMEAVSGGFDVKSTAKKIGEIGIDTVLGFIASPAGQKMINDYLSKGANAIKSKLK